MKKTVSTLTLFLMTAALLLNTIGIAWLSDNGMTSGINIEANVHKSYFQSGNGSEGAPYEIANPVQLYYFSWLQYLGFFNEKDESDNIKPFYFRVSENLDMTGYSLPPIGTTDNPFLGNFDGEGHTISNLTVENEYLDLLEPPNDTEEGFGGVEIIGFFGVVGKLEGDTSYKYKTEANEVKNLILQGLTVKTQTDNALIGLVAGYVNGKVDQVGVVDSTVDIKKNTQPLGYTGNISDYALIGYCTEGHKDDVFTVNLDLFDPSVDVYEVVPNQSSGGDGQGWGGSIKMDQMYNWLVNVRDNLANNIGSSQKKFVYERTDIKTESKTVTIDSKVAYKKVYYDSKFGAYVFSPAQLSGWGNQTPDYSANPDDLFNYLSGGTQVTLIEYKSGEETPAYYIADGNNYISVSGSYPNVSITNTPSSANAAKWIFSNGANGGTAYTVVDGFIYYLNSTNNALSIALASSDATYTQWSVDDVGITYNSRYISYNNGWVLAQSEGRIKISSSDGNNYLTVVNGAITNTPYRDEAVSWTFGSSGTIYTTVGNDRYYLRYDSGLTANRYQSTKWTYSNNQLTYKSGRTTYYVGYSGGSWKASNSPASVTLVSEKINELIETTATEYTYTTTVKMDYGTSNKIFDNDGNEVITTGTSHDANGSGVTYYPLTFERDENGNPIGISGGNTGYIMAGSQDRNKPSSPASFPDRTGDIRVSRYETDDSLNNSTRPYGINYLHQSFSNKQQVPAISNKENVTDAEKAAIAAWGLNKYAECYKDYIDSITQTGTSYCYGLHFMDAEISNGSVAEGTLNKDNFVKVDVNILGKTYSGYEMPTSCIDFQLKEAGFINFIAGTYFSGNNTFFSLHKIERNPENTCEIISVKEIKYIYGKLTSDNKIDFKSRYYYTYTDGSADVDDIDSIEDDGYQIIFDTAWITNPSNLVTKSAYYFEIPVNEGEYALGSVEGKKGAYLVYLDLAANAQIIERTRVDEKTVTTERASSIPDGVSMLESAAAGTGSIDSKNSAFVTIPSGTYGASDFSQSGNVITDSSIGHTAAHVGSGLELRDGNGQLLTVPITKTTTVEKTTYYDNNLVTNVQTVTVITKTTENEGGQETVSYTKTVTVTDAEGKETVKEPETSQKALTPDISDSKTNNPGENVLLSAQYVVSGDASTFAMEHEYSWESLERSSTTVKVNNPTYTLTFVNTGADSVTVGIVPTEEGASSGINFVVNGGAEPINFKGTTEKKTVSVAKKAS